MAHDHFRNNFTTGNAFDWRLVMDMHDCKCGAFGHYMQGNGVVTCGKRGCKQDVFIANGGATVDEIIEGAKDIRIAELEAQLKTAKRDGILEAIDKLVGYSVPNDFQSDWVYSSDDLVEYANSLTGE